MRDIIGNGKSSLPICHRRPNASMAGMVGKHTHPTRVWLARARTARRGQTPEGPGRAKAGAGPGCVKARGLDACPGWNTRGCAHGTCVSEAQTQRTAGWPRGRGTVATEADTLASSFPHGGSPRTGRSTIHGCRP